MGSDPIISPTMTDHGTYLELTLPDGSLARLEKKTFTFLAPGRPPEKVAVGPGLKAPASGARVNFTELSRVLTTPTKQFTDCFRRISATPRYSPIGSVHDFDVRGITQIFAFPQNYRGGTFSSSDSRWLFLDGGIFSHNGYGWGSHSWTVVQGFEALRVVCLLDGITQPKLLKGEPPRRPLAYLLADLTRLGTEGESTP